MGMLPECGLSIHEIATTARRALFAKPRHELLALLRDFLVAHTLKDCSIIVCLQCIAQEDAWCSSNDIIAWDHTSGAAYRARVTFVDLDMKPSARMNHYAELDRRCEQNASFSKKSASNNSDKC